MNTEYDYLIAINSMNLKSLSETYQENDKEIPIESLIDSSLKSQYQFPTPEEEYFLKDKWEMLSEDAREIVKAITEMEMEDCLTPTGKVGKGIRENIIGWMAGKLGLFESYHVFNEIQSFVKSDFRIYI